jgi:hypothetical protein
MGDGGNFGRGGKAGGMGSFIERADLIVEP